MPALEISKMRLKRSRGLRNINKLAVLSGCGEKGKTMGLSVNEQETVVNFERNTDKATVYTSDATMLTKLHKLMEKSPKEWRLIDKGRVNGDVVSETFECPKRLISFRTSTASRVMTEEQREAAAERLKKAREKQ